MNAIAQLPSVLKNIFVTGKCLSSLLFINQLMYLNLLSFCEDPPSRTLNKTFCSGWYKQEIKNNAWFIYAVGVNFAERIFIIHDVRWIFKTSGKYLIVPDVLSGV